MEHTEKAEEEFKKKLTPEQYAVLREGGTEAPFTGKYVDTKEKGMFRCAACGNELFSSDTKFESGTGWPSFDQAIPGSVELVEDTSHGMKRTEVRCARCGSHLGHVFDDPSTGSTGSPQAGSGQAVLRADGKPATKRYCINSVCLDLENSP